MGFKSKIGLILLCVTIQNVRPQGYGPPPPAPPKSQAAEANGEKVKFEGQGQVPAADPNWWKRQDAFQQPPNYPGLQRGDDESAQKSNPIPATVECMLRLKSDCFGGGRPPTGAAPGKELTNQNFPASNYQSESFATSPVYTAYVFPAIGTFNIAPGQTGPLDPAQQNGISYSSGPNSGTGSPTFDPNQPPYYYPQNFEPQSPSNQLPNKTPANYGYKPSVVPYKAPPPTQQQKSPSNGYQSQPNGQGTPSGQNGPELPYPGCPAAMLCVPEDFCDAQGTSAGKPIQLSAAEKVYRVALGACSAPTTGEVGVCCRDPDYKDPWPMIGGAMDNGQRQGKGVPFDDGQYRDRPQQYNNQRQGKGIQYDDGQYRPQSQFIGQPQPQGAVPYDDGQYRPREQFSKQNEPIPAQQQVRPLSPEAERYPQYQDQFAQFGQRVPQQQQPPHPAYQRSYPQQQVQVPAPASSSGVGQSQSSYAFGIRAAFPSRRTFVEECPNSMKCLRESYCQVPNPNEGNSDQFDIRVGIKRNAAKLKCRQDNLPVDGVCCYLREDYMSQVTTRPFPTAIPASFAEHASQTCGIRRHKSRSPETEFGEFPWHALIRAGRNICSGAIIGPKIVATTASCVQSLLSQDISIRVGEWDRGVTAEKKPHLDLDVDLVIPHPEFNPITLSANVALLLTKDIINFDYHAGRICLPQPVTNFQGRKCSVTGWGTINSKQFQGNGSALEILSQVDTSVLTKSDCQRQLRSRGSSISIEVCAVPEQRQNLCLADEGSPLACEMANTGEYILAGFYMGKAGRGISCDQEGVTAVFTNVTAVVDWIYKFVKQTGRTG